MSYLHTWGCRIGRVHVTWWDLWARRPCFEIARDPLTVWDLWEREIP